MDRVHLNEIICALHPDNLSWKGVAIGGSGGIYGRCRMCIMGYMFIVSGSGELKGRVYTHIPFFLTLIYIFVVIEVFFETFGISNIFIYVHKHFEVSIKVKFIIS